MFGHFLFLILLFLFIAYLFQILLMFDVGKHVFTHRPGPCRQLKTIVHGSEDIALVEPDGLAFISSGWLNLRMSRPGIEGNIFLFNFSHPDDDPLKLEINGMENRSTFHPHGITHWASNGRIRLYVINHNRPPNFEHLIEVFDFDKKQRLLNHVRTVRDKKFIRPNNLVAIAEDVLLVGNDALSQTGLSTLFEYITFQKTGSIVLHNGRESFWMAEGMMSPNGMATDSERKHLIVAHMHDRTIGLYRIDVAFKTLERVLRREIGTNLDNIWMEENGRTLWIGAHPILKKGLAHFADCEDLSISAPSQILRMKFSSDWLNSEISEIFVDDGRFLSGSSGAVHFKGKLLIGSVCRQAVICDLSNYL